MYQAKSGGDQRGLFSRYAKIIMAQCGPYEMMNVQQFPLSIRGYAATNPNQQVVIILFDAKWRNEKPRILSVLKGVGDASSMTGFRPYNMDNVTFYTIEGFFDDKLHPQILEEFLLQKTDTQPEVFIGEFLVGGSTGDALDADLLNLGKVVEQYRLKYATSDTKEEWGNDTRS
jgi:hypothetical protein